MDSEPFPGSSEPLVPVQSRKNRFKNDQIKKESIEAAVGKMAASEAPPSPLLLALANKKSEMANSFWANWGAQHQKSSAAAIQYNPILALIRPNSLFGLLRPGFLDLSTLLMLQNLVNNNNRQVKKKYIAHSLATRALNLLKAVFFFL